MSVAKQFQAFKANASGWAEITLAQFRELQSMRKKKEWAKGDEKLVLTIAAADTWALACLFKGSDGHKPYESLMKSSGIVVQPQPMPKSELEGHLKELVKNCRRDGWPAQRFRDYMAYLDSDMSIADFAKKTESKETPTKDLFAERYRSGNSEYKSVVKRYLLEGALMAGSVKAAGPPTLKVGNPLSEVGRTI
jgi:hypothetical protein